MIEVGNIVTLENGKDFLILEECNMDIKRYVYAVRVLEDETPTSEYIIYEAVKSDEGEFLKDVTDKGEYETVIENFKNIIADKFASGEYNDMIPESGDGE